MEPKLEFDIDGVSIKITAQQARKLRDDINNILGDGGRHYPFRPFPPQIPWDGPPPYPPTPLDPTYLDPIYRD